MILPDPAGFEAFRRGARGKFAPMEAPNTLGAQRRLDIKPIYSYFVAIARMEARTISDVAGLGRRS
jgi:hypothetical protein